MPGICAATTASLGKGAELYVLLGWQSRMNLAELHESAGVAGDSCRGQSRD